MARVFISHSSRDNELAKEIVRWLNERSFQEIFLDIDKHGGIPPGANWEREIYQKIDSAQAVILIVTSNWHESKWCFVEFAQARALGKPIFPVILEPGAGSSSRAIFSSSISCRTGRAGWIDWRAN